MGSFSMTLVARWLGLPPETAPAVAATGVDQIAVGWLTHSAKVLDIGLDHA